MKQFHQFSLMLSLLSFLLQTDHFRATYMQYEALFIKLEPLLSSLALPRVLRILFSCQLGLFYCISFLIHFRNYLFNDNGIVLLQGIIFLLLVRAQKKKKNELTSPSYCSK